MLTWTLETWGSIRYQRHVRWTERNQFLSLLVVVLNEFIVLATERLVRKVYNFRRVLITEHFGLFLSFVENKWRVFLLLLVDIAYFREAKCVWALTIEHIWILLRFLRIKSNKLISLRKDVHFDVTFLLFDGTTTNSPQFVRVID